MNEEENKLLLQIDRRLSMIETYAQQIPDLFKTVAIIENQHINLEKSLGKMEGSYDYLHKRLESVNMKVNTTNDEKRVLSGLIKLILPILLSGAIWLGIQAVKVDRMEQNINHLFNEVAIIRNIND